jgi:DNA-binding beta-propeller fold protein YncE
MEHCYLPGMLMKFSLVRIMSLLICLALLASGCATSLPPIQYDTPFATIEISLVRGAFGFFGTAAFVTKDAVWVVIPEEKHLIKIDPLQTKLVAGTPIGAKLNTNVFYRHLPAENGNAVWVAAKNTVLRIDPESREVVARIPFGTGEPFILSASDSAVWVGTLESGWYWVRHYTVSKIDPQTNSVVTTLPQEFSTYSTRVMVSTNTLWLLDGWACTLSRIDPTSGQVVATVARGPYKLATVGEGAIWFVNAREGNVIRINPETNQVTATIPLPDPDDGRPDESYGSPRSAEDVIWIASSAERFHGIDPSTNQVVATLNAKTYHGGGFALGHGALWTPRIKDAGYKKDRLVIEVYRLPNWKSVKR